MYIAYNAWYRQVTNTTNDRQALSLLKKRVIIWNDYANGKTLKPLGVMLEKLVELTQREPLKKTAYWSGSIENTTDWCSLIEYWYQIRCLLVHGSLINARYVCLAYETLHLFMTEIITRVQNYHGQTATTTLSVQQCLTDDDHIDSFHLRNKKLKSNYSAATIWAVDMKRAN